MSQTSTQLYVARLEQLKPSDLWTLRAHAGQPLDASLDGFDLFTGLWWPLRQRSAQAPRREIAWLVAKLYATAPLPYEPGRTFADQLSSCAPLGPQGQTRLVEAFDRLLLISLDGIEAPLGRMLKLLSFRARTLDWAQLIDDLSAWERTSIREQWVDQFLARSDGGPKKGEQNVD